MILELTAAPADRVEADGVVVFLHAEDRPPPGSAGLLDWRLNGALSRLLRDGWYRAGAGETLLVATGRRVAAPRLLVVGLGSRPDAGAVRIRSAGALALTKAAGLGLRRLALGLPGPADPPLPEVERGVSLVEGLLDALPSMAGASGGEGTGPRPHVLLLAPAAVQPDMAAALARLRARLAPGLQLDLRPLSASLGAALPRLGRGPVQPPS